MHARLPRLLAAVGLMLSVPVAAQAGQEGPVPVPVAAQAGQEGPVPVPVATQAGQEGPVPVPVAAQTGQESSAPVPVAAQAGQRSSERMRLTAGTMQAGGVVSVSSNQSTPLEGNQNTTTSYDLTLYPSFGYFVANRLELTVDLRFSKVLGENSSYSSTPLGISVGIKYHIDFSVLFLYFGGNFGVDLSFPGSSAGPNEKTTETLAFGVPVGILVPLNQWVALDIGTRLRITLPFNTGTKTLNVGEQEGFMGVEAFF